MAEKPEWHQGIIDSIPEECPITLDHAIVHIRSARNAARDGDTEQVIHDADMAGRILLTLAWSLDS